MAAPKTGQGYKEAFKLFDKNGDGKITSGEIRAVLKECGLSATEDEVKQMITEADTNKNGVIEYDEFAKFMKKVEDRVVTEAFKLIDTDNSGYISAKEIDNLFKSIGRNLTPKEIQEQMKAVDLDGDKQISLDAYEEKFAKFDKNGDGKICKTELRGVLRALNRNPSDDNLKKVMAEVDTNASGSIEYEEFVQMMIKIDADIDRRLKATFDEYDTDRDGFMSPGELDVVFQDMGIEMTPEELTEEIRKVDLNVDGKLSFEEFRRLFRRI